MVSPDAENLIYDVKLSSVGPASVTGADVVHEPSDMDLAMKLHYLRGIYFFQKEAVEGLTISKLKESMFYWLDSYYFTCGRLRRSSTSGRPHIKCNDCGVRIIEAQCSLSMDDFLELRDCSLQNQLFYNEVIGPVLIFSPLVMIQLTWFKCGGMSVGLRWAHVLGDAFSATEYINKWGQVLADYLQPSKSLGLPKYQVRAQTQISTMNSENSPPPQPAGPMDADSSPLPKSVKQVHPVGDYWIIPSNRKMGTFSFEVTATQLAKLQSTVPDQSQDGKISYFTSISAVIWQCLAKIRQESEPKIITVCRRDESEYMGNCQILCVVKADYEIAKAKPEELANLIRHQNTNERSLVEQAIGKDPGAEDYVVYGANPTFVDLEEVNLYGLELNGQKPIYANYMIHGVGDEGVITVLPSANGGRTVTITVPENEVSQLKTELEEEWNLG